MKTCYQLFILLFFSFTQVFSQTVAPPPYADIDTTHRAYVNQVFGLLEPNRVSTGLLIDYSFDFTDPKIDQGNIFSELYKNEKDFYIFI